MEVLGYILPVALEQEGYSLNLMANIPAPLCRRKLPRTLSESETKRLLASIDDERDYAIMVVLLDTGIREGRAGIRHTRGTESKRNQSVRQDQR